MVCRSNETMREDYIFEMLCENSSKERKTSACLEFENRNLVEFATAVESDRNPKDGGHAA